LRSADAAGVHGVIITKDQAVGITPTVSKVASGAAETVPLYKVTNLARALGWLKDAGLWIVGAAGEADKTVYQTDLNLPLAIVMGAEEKGLRRLTREHCDFLVKIPMLGQVESLNVSVATGILLFEAVRQRTKH
jgi:23S rRNA (guanosine2251-2'-O)-methyltransferase